MTFVNLPVTVVAQAYAPRGASGSAESVVRQVLPIRPRSIGRHVETVGQFLAPVRRRGGLAPVVGDADRLAVLELADRDVAVQASVAVIACPLDDYDIVESQPPANFECQLGKVALMSATSFAVWTASRICGHW
jgi:hypothetical protein